MYHPERYQGTPLSPLLEAYNTVMQNGTNKEKKTAAYKFLIESSLKNLDTKAAANLLLAMLHLANKALGNAQKKLPLLHVTNLLITALANDDTKILTMLSVRAQVHLLTASSYSLNDLNDPYYNEALQKAVEAEKSIFTNEPLPSLSAGLAHKLNAMHLLRQYTDLRKELQRSAAAKNNPQARRGSTSFGDFDLLSTQNEQKTRNKMLTLLQEAWKFEQNAIEMGFNNNSIYIYGETYQTKEMNVFKNPGQGSLEVFHPKLTDIMGDKFSLLQVPGPADPLGQYIPLNSKQSSEACAHHMFGVFLVSVGLYDDAMDHFKHAHEKRYNYDESRYIAIYASLNLDGKHVASWAELRDQLFATVKEYNKDPTKEPHKTRMEFRDILIKTLAEEDNKQIPDNKKKENLYSVLKDILIKVSSTSNRMDRSLSTLTGSILDALEKGYHFECNEEERNKITKRSLLRNDIEGRLKKRKAIFNSHPDLFEKLALPAVRLADQEDNKHSEPNNELQNFARDLNIPRLEQNREFGEIHNAAAPQTPAALGVPETPVSRRRSLSAEEVAALKNRPLPPPPPAAALGKGDVNDSNPTPDVTISPPPEETSKKVESDCAATSTPPSLPTMPRPRSVSAATPPPPPPLPTAASAATPPPPLPTAATVAPATTTTPGPLTPAGLAERTGTLRHVDPPAKGQRNSEENPRDDLLAAVRKGIALRQVVTKEDPTRGGPSPTLFGDAVLNPETPAGRMVAAAQERELEEVVMPSIPPMEKTPGDDDGAWATFPDDDKKIPPLVKGGP